MIGKFGASAYKQITDFKNHKDYLAFMYGGMKGFIARSVISENTYRQSLFSSDWIINRNRYYGINNIYTSLNTFCKRERTVAQLKRLNALYIDIDCYKLGLTQEQVLFELETDYFGRSLPHPTFVINSGRGLYLIWKIDEDRNALPRWTSIQRYFFEVCKHFNADAQALDAARIFRVPFSVNSKNNNPVSIMRFNDVKYTLYEIIKEHEIKPYVQTTRKSYSKHPYGEATERQRRCAAILAEKHGLDLPNFENYEETCNFISTYYDRPHDENIRGNIIYFNASNTMPLLSGRCQDIIRLFSLRRGDDCRRREVGLFLFRLWLCESTNDYDYALRETLLLNDSFDRPLPEKYVIEKTASAEKKTRSGETYKYGKQKLIEVLDINVEEMQHMKYIYICPEILQERIRVKNRRAYLSRLESEGKTTKKESVLQRRIDIKTMLDEGKDKTAICNALGISGKTFNRDMIVISTENIKGRVIDDAKSTCEAVKSLTSNTIKSVLSSFAVRGTKIQPPYYERTCVACSAFVSSFSNLSGIVQLSLFDVFGCYGWCRRMLSGMVRVLDSS